MDNIDSVLYINRIIPQVVSTLSVTEHRFSHEHPRTHCNWVTFILFLPASSLPIFRYSYILLTVRTVKSRRKMNCPQVSQSNGTISYNVDEYFLIPEKSPVSKLSEYWCCQSEIIYIDHTSKQSINPPCPRSLVGFWKWQ